MNVGRRSFIGGALAFSGLAGCRSPWWFGEAPTFRFGVISDLHVTTPKSTDRFRRALAYFRARGADAVAVTGDLTDWGLRSQFGYVRDVWNDVFPDGRGADGKPVRRLFVTGNHDFDGWWYGDITLDMHTQGYSEEDALSRHGMKENWEKTFGEPYGEIRRRSVCGFDFVSAEWRGTAECENNADVAAWLVRHADELPKDRPFFFLRHEPVGGTVPNSATSADALKLRDALGRFPNCIAFTGHTHWTLNDERSVWQDGFTAVSVPSMSYSTVPHGYENGSGPCDGTSTASMPLLPARADHLEAQGFFVSVYPDRVEIERRDFEDDVEAAAPWILPLSVDKGRPYAPDARVRRLPVPRFPASAAVRTRTVNSVRRDGRWTVFVELEFPAAVADGGRVFDYEAQVVGVDGTRGATKLFLSPAFYRPAKYEPKTLRFLFDAMDLPEHGRYRIEVRPRNCFGVAGNPIRTDVFESKPGKDISKWRSWKNH